MISPTASSALTANAIASTADAQTSAMGGIIGSKRHMTDAQMNETAKDFESMFLSQMLEPMFGDSVGD
jgi:Rod binding domain-containing protein